MSHAHFSLGPGTYAVPMSLHAENRRRLCDRLRARGVAPGAVVLLQGGEQRCEYDTDREELFKQESFFQWAFGVKEPGFFGAIEVGSGRSWLFAPRLPAEWAVWMGAIHPPEHFRALYEVEEVRFVDELAAVLAKLDAKPLLRLRGRNTDSGSWAEPAGFEGIEKFATDDEVLHPEMVECRVIKTAAEIELLAWVNEVSSAAHVAVMKKVRPGLSEYHLEADFLHHVYANGGCRFSAYTCICGCGPNSATLHYGHAGAPNDRVLRDGELFLNDSGAEYHGYASDITCSYPVNGRFTPEQRMVYEAVLAANRAVQAAMKPGVAWPDMHRLAERTILQHLLRGGLLRGEVDAMMAARVPYLFMPHGLGHLMGLDVHDVGGYPAGVERSAELGLKSLRCGRALEAGMVITVEPGIYFVDALLEPALGDPKLKPFLVEDVVRRFRGFGGVRIEDDVLVTPTGSRNLTNVPREVDDIERVMAEGRRAAEPVLA
ncbi:MAG: aminopeptidase P family protein [Vicinamibacteria bacterium]|nr:aminopeptidase P family protein [Vicinamibacteria bacterium]